MAAAARPGPSDARVPGPLCGGLIHPIAGKCKHCKADLASFQASRPAAATPLPALSTVASRPQRAIPSAPVAAPAYGSPAASAYAGLPAVSAYAAPAASAYAGTLAASAYAAPAASTYTGLPAASTYAGTPAAAAYAGLPAAAQTVLPPRPTSRGQVAEPRVSSWRSWPVVVIALAMLAIVIAVVLMVWPVSSQRDAGKRSSRPQPAPERMDTEPEVSTPPPSPAQGGSPRNPSGLQPQAAPAPDRPIDPWAPEPDVPLPQAPASPDPHASADPDPDDDVDLGDLLRMLRSQA
jgi:hypothetical protein